MGQGTMAFQDRNFIEDINMKINRLKNGEIPFDDCFVTFFFSQVRNALERDNELHRYEYICFYSNWILHPQVDRNSVGQKIGQGVVSVLKNKQIPIDLKTKELNKHIGQWCLQADLKVFCGKYQVDMFFLDDERWKAIFGQLARLLIWKPINLTKYDLAKVSSGEIDGVNYDGHPVFWLSSDGPGQRLLLNVAIVGVGQSFSPSLIHDHSQNGTIIFEAGLFHDAR